MFWEDEEDEVPQFNHELRAAAEEGIEWLSGGKRKAPMMKGRADGSCGVCEKPVEARSGNKFYCLNCQSYGYVRMWYAADPDL